MNDDAPITIKTCVCGHAEKAHGPKGCAGCARPQHCLEYCAVELTPAQRTIVACLRPDKELPVRDVTDAGGYSMSWTSDVLRQLRRLGLVTHRRVRDLAEPNITWSMWKRRA